MEDVKFCIDQRAPMTLKLPGLVEIDEACLYRLKKGQNGRIAKIIYWVFGMKCRTTKKVIIYPARFRTRDYLLPFIFHHIPQKSTIYSDRVSVYFNNRTKSATSYLSQFGYHHIGINHSCHFVWSIGKTIHINIIERTCISLKTKFKDNKPRVEIDKHISEFMFEVCK